MKKKTKKTIKRTIRQRRTRKTSKKVVRRRLVKKIKHRKIVRHKKIVRRKTFIGKGILEQLFESQAKVKLMKFFFRNSTDSFQLREIFKMLRMNPRNIRQELGKLEKLDFVNSRKKQGRMVYFLNSNFDFLKELKDLILKSTISSKAELINNVRKIGNIKLLVLGGVFRSNESDEADLLIVGDKINQRRFSTFLKDLEAEVGKELNCALMSAKEFNYRYDMYDRFVRDLISENSDVLINKLNLW
jgi:uncharacterized Rmd1/YagE family protein